MATALLRFDLIALHIRGILKHGDPSPETARVLEEIRALVPHELTEMLV